MCDSKIIKEFYYKFETISAFEIELKKVLGVGITTSNFRQTPLFSDKNCLQIILESSFLLEFLIHTIDGVIQPYIDNIAIFVPDGQLEASTVLNVNFFKENINYVYNVQEKSGCFKCAKKVIIRNIGNGVRIIRITK